MKIKEREKVKIKLKNYQIIIIEILIIIFIYYITNLEFTKKITECYIYKTTGIQCPGCGGTRCIQNLLKGNIISAFKYHAIFTITAIYLFVLNIIYLINRNKKEEKKIMTWIYPKYWYVMIWIIILLIYTIFRNL